jgi:hypothetical protein
LVEEAYAPEIPVEEAYENVDLPVTLRMPATPTSPLLPIVVVAVEPIARVLPEWLLEKRLEVVALVAVSPPLNAK